MSRLGQKFRAAREAKGWTVEQIARDTRISAVYLQALEDGNESAFPAPIFYRSFIRQYAQVLDVPETEYQQEVERSAADEQLHAPPLLPTHFSAKRYDVPPMPTGPRLSREEVRRWALRLAGLALVVVGCSGVYEAWRKWPAGQTMPGWLKWSSNANSPQPKPAPPQPEQASSVTPASNENPAEGEVQVTLQAKELTWVEAFSGSRRIYIGLLQPGETKTLESADRIRIHIGNAGGIEIRHNGKSIPQPGSRGQVLTMDFTLSDHAIIRPPPKADADKS